MQQMKRQAAVKKEVVSERSRDNHTRSLYIDYILTVYRLANSP